LHLGIADGLTEGTDAAVTALVGYDPRKAQCRLRLRVPSERADEGDAVLTLRGKAGRRG
jgi:hypothetical protein